MAKAKTSEATKGVIALVVIVVCVVAIVVYQRTRTNQGARPIKIVTIDVETGKAVDVVKRPGVGYPLENPETGKKTLYMAYVCKDEKILFPGQGMVMTCPHCGSQNVGGLNYDDEEFKKYPVNMQGFQPPETE